MNKKIYSFLIAALLCNNFLCKAYTEQDEEQNPDLEIALKYHRINPIKKSHDVPKKTCPMRLTSYTTVFIVTLLLYQASDASDNS